MFDHYNHYKMKKKTKVLLLKYFYKKKIMQNKLF